MASPQLLYFHAPEVGLSFRAKLLAKESPDVAEQLLSQLPMQSTLGHVVISGQAFWLPTRIVHLGRNNMVKRHPGAVYLNSVGGSLCLTYGSITESALVNKVAEVLEEDLPIISQLGRLVFDKTVTSARHTLLTIRISLVPSKSGVTAESRPVDMAVMLTSRHECTWREAASIISAQVDRVWIHEPEDIKKISWGIIDSGAGSGEQYFSVMVHLKSFLLHLGCDVLYRLLKISQYEEIALPVLRRMTREFLEQNFNTFEMLTDLGLSDMGEIGDVYLHGLASLTSKDDYRSLTGVLFTYVCRMHRWVHFIFPWNIGVAFPHRKPEEIMTMSMIVNGLPTPAISEQSVGGAVGGKYDAMMRMAGMVDESTV
ncbi:uncharacterized protein BO97DRAFT_458747 [Aspergillus homomorphus CBS 101889]|uniref:Cucumopine synthase C-terminal helical bundle domain-containing protein n=1 Tax=Aspergillus homomorphus (strain CBS 101889) TaxID=1450537 RepID=A0A395ICB5_ASPHC|nr:hypothetical protein BO97DRAFT_458747 [Aspergillus homomorphus CBS 101889]RAL15814.1 hypothetical protein BO97DRAFT_458747 [Aspergillus homomorphus CBS 101889]